MNAYMASLVGEMVVLKFFDGSEASGTLEVHTPSGLFEIPVSWHPGRFSHESVLWIIPASEAGLRLQSPKQVMVDDPT